MKSKINNKLKRKKKRRNKSNKNKILFNDNNDEQNINKKNYIKFQNADNIDDNEIKTKIKSKNKNKIINLTSIVNNNQDILKYNDNELNSLEYLKALEYDKRTYIQYYLSLLRTKHLLIFSFYINNKDYNSKTALIILFIKFLKLYILISFLHLLAYL